jgi:hypothetical protein
MASECTGEPPNPQAGARSHDVCQDIHAKDIGPLLALTGSSTERVATTWTWTLANRRKRLLENSARIRNSTGMDLPLFGRNSLNASQGAWGLLSSTTPVNAPSHGNR